MAEFRIIPILGRKTDVLPDDDSMIQMVAKGVGLSHDAGGLNYDLHRKNNACTKSFGYAKMTDSATDQATKCLGLFELYDGTNRDRIMFDDGRFYVHDSYDPYEAILNFDAGVTAFVAGETVTDGTTSATAVIHKVTLTSGAWDGTGAGTLHIHTIVGNFGNNNTITSASGEATVNGALTTVTFANDNVDLYSMIRVGSYLVFADRGETTPYKWKNGDDNPSKLIDPSGGSGYTEFKFRILNYFQRRIVGLYSDQTNGDIDIRWTGSLPDLSSDVEFPAANQLYAPNDDSIVGARKMGEDKLYVYCENSINQLVYHPDFASVFRIYTVVPNQGGVNHHSIVSLGNRHFLFNKNYGFCEYRGGNQFPYGGRPISEPIEEDVRGINTSVYSLIVGTFWPLTREIVWTVPTGGASTPNQLWFYGIDTGQWRFEEKTMRYVDDWLFAPSFTWNNLITALGGTGATWSPALGAAWSYYLSERQQLTYANTDGHVYFQTTDALDGSALDGYRIEPIMHFGNRRRYDYLSEIWFDIGNTGDYSIDVYHRSGNTTGELLAQTWTSIGSVSNNSPYAAVLNSSQNARLHQIKWGTDAADEKFQINGITFMYEPGAETK